MTKLRKVTEFEWVTGNYRRIFTHLRRIQKDRKTRLMYCGFARELSEHIPNQEWFKIIEAAEGYADQVLLYRKLKAAYANVNDSTVDLSGIQSDISIALYYACSPRLGLASCEVVELKEKMSQLAVVRDVFGNPFREIPVEQNWKSSNAVDLCQTMYDSRDFSNMPILADLLQESGCENEHILNHCRSAHKHYRGCWAIDSILGKS